MLFAFFMLLLKSFQQPHDLTCDVATEGVQKHIKQYNCLKLSQTGKGFMKCKTGALFSLEYKKIILH